MNESDFWNNLDNFVEQQSGGKGVEKVGEWLDQHTTDVSGGKASKGKGKSNKNSPGENEASNTPRTSPNVESTSKKVSIVVKEDKKSKLKSASKKDDKKAFSPKKYIRKSKLRRKRRNRHDAMYFGPQVECNFNLPRVAGFLERLMGSSVVRLTDRKYMLDLQKRIQEDYYDTLMKRISQRQFEEVERELGIMLKPRIDIASFSRILFTAQSIVLASELEREKRMGHVGTEKYPKMINEHPVFVVNQKTNNLLMKKREKLKTVREKNAERLIKQGKRWERERIILEEQERLSEIQAKKEREQMLEDQTLYIFDSEQANAANAGGLDLLKIKNRKFTACEIDVKDFLLSEKNESKKRMLAKATSSEERSFDSRKSKQLTSLDEKVEEDTEATKTLEVVKEIEIPPPIEEEIPLAVTEDMKKKVQSKKDDDPRLSEFKEAESVKSIYDLAEEIIAGDGEAGRKKMWRQYKQIRKAANIPNIKAS
ncbi:unnamed protein product [Diamesa hyperborea]